MTGKVKNEYIRQFYFIELVLVAIEILQIQQFYYAININNANDYTCKNTKFYFFLENYMTNT